MNQNFNSLPKKVTVHLKRDVQNGLTGEGCVRVLCSCTAVGWLHQRVAVVTARRVHMPQLISSQYRQCLCLTRHSERTKPLCHN